MNDPGFFSQFFIRDSIERTFSPGWIHVKVRALVPTLVELAPSSGKNDIQSILVPPEDVLAMHAQAGKYVVGISHPPPLSKIDDKQAAVEILSLARQA